MAQVPAGTRDDRGSYRAIKSVHRACKILHRLTDEPAGLTLGDLASYLGVHKSTALRLLAQLERAGIVERSVPPGRYYIGLASIAMAGSALGRFEVLSSATPHLRRLAQTTQQTVNLTIRYLNEILIIDHVPPSNALRNFNWLGRRAPLHKGAAAKALLAHLSDVEISEYLALLDGEGDSVRVDQIWGEIREIRERGFAINRGEVDSGVFAVGAPLFNAEGRCCASISIAGYQEDFTDERIVEFSHLALDATRLISHQLGYQGRQAVGIA